MFFTTRKLKRAVAFIIATVVILLLASCGVSKSASRENTEHEKAVSEMSQKYEATYFDDVISNGKYSVDIIDNYKGENIYLDYGSIRDIYYEDGEKWLSLNYTSWDEYFFKIKITDEQYNKIQAFSVREYIEDSFSCLVFRLDDISLSLPVVNVFAEDDYYTEYAKECVIEGTLIDVAGRG